MLTRGGLVLIVCSILVVPTGAGLAVRTYHHDSVSIPSSTYAIHRVAGTGSGPPPIERWRFSSRGHFWHPPMAADVNGDGHLEVLIGSGDRNLYVLSANGSLLWNFTTERPVYSGGVSTMPTVADVTGDGRVEVLIGARVGALYCLDGQTGELVWRYQTLSGNGLFPGIYASPAVAQLGTSRKKVVLFGAEEGIICLNGATGTLRWNYSTPYPICSSAGVADIDGDGELEGVIGSNEDLIRSFDLRSGRVEWATELRGGNSVIWTNPSLVDIDGDGITEIFVITLAGQLYRLEGDTGEKTLLGTFPYTEGSPVVVDVDGNGAYEVLVPEYYGTLYCMDALDGTLRWGRDLDRNLQAAPAVADIDLDGRLDVVVGTSRGLGEDILYACEARNGAEKWSIPINCTAFSSPLVTDLDDDGNQEIVVGSGNDVLCLGVSRVNQYAYVWPWIGERGGSGTVGNWTDHDGDGLTDTYELTAGSDPRVRDTDNDGASDYQEFVSSTNPREPDTDGDGLPDGWEISNALNPLDPADAAQDSDADGLSNTEEYAIGSDPWSRDSDDDGLRDYDEVEVYGTSPICNDTDHDGLSDYDEVEVYGTSPTSNDTDEDGLSDYEEVEVYGTSPTSRDTDNDGLPDAWEIQFNLSPFVDDAEADPDGDALSNLGEYLTGTSPRALDSDGDGIPDGWEVANGFDPVNSTLPLIESVLYVSPILVSLGVTSIAIIALTYGFRDRVRPRARTRSLPPSSHHPQTESPQDPKSEDQTLLDS